MKTPTRGRFAPLAQVAPPSTNRSRSRYHLNFLNMRNWLNIRLNIRLNVKSVVHAEFEGLRTSAWDYWSEGKTSGVIYKV